MGDDSDTEPQIRIDRVERMPRKPEPYELRDWAQVAREYDSFVFDLEREGDHLPFVWLDDREHNYDRTSFGLTTYVGGYQENRDEGINCLGAVVGASLVGVDKTEEPGGYDWVRMCKNWFNADNGQRIYLNGKNETAGGSFWYDLFPNVLAFQLADRYPDVESLQEQMRAVADRWHEACVALGDGDVSEPDFDHQGFDFEEMEPTEGHHREPEAAAAVAWLQYAAYNRFGDEKYLEAADGALQFLEGRDENPFYEILLAYGALLAARMNAELGRDYDLDSLVDWCFGPSDVRSGWGIIADRWGDYDCHGLQGSLSDSDGYAFAMNTFGVAAAMFPTVRYDQRYARSLGRWLLNVANNARLFYPGHLPVDSQDNREWSDANDEYDCVAYEGLRSLGWGAHSVVADYETRFGHANGSYEDTGREDDGREQVLETEPVDGEQRLEHVWKLPLPASKRHTITVAATADTPVEFSYATEPDGEYTQMFTIDSTTDRETYGLTEEELVWKWNYDGDVYVRAERSPADGEQSQIAVDAIGAASIMGRPDDPYCSDEPGPHGTADAMFGFGSETNLSLYGSSHVGFLGAIVGTTDVEGVLELDCLATDFFTGDAYPTSLYYNPYDEAVTVDVDVEDGPRDLYETVSHEFVERDVNGSTPVVIPPDQSVVIVSTPTDGVETIEDGTLLVDGVAVDYRYPTAD